MATTATRPATLRAEIDRLAAHYAFRDPEAVAAYVRDHPEVLDPLQEAVDVVPRYFGPNALLALEVERDREADDHAVLFALVLTDFDVTEAQAAMDRFDEEWWLDAGRQTGAALVFDVEFI